MNTFISDIWLLYAQGIVTNREYLKTWKLIKGNRLNFAKLGNIVIRGKIGGEISLEVNVCVPFRLIQD